jgi:hypothetical protein
VCVACARPCEGTPPVLVAARPRRHPSPWGALPVPLAVRPRRRPFLRRPRLPRLCPRTSAKGKDDHG